MRRRTAWVAGALASALAAGCSVVVEGFPADGSAPQAGVDASSSQSDAGLGVSPDASAAGLDAGSAALDAGALMPDAGTSAGTMINPAPGSRFFIGGNFWRIDWEGTSDFFQSGVDWATSTNPWKPEFLTDLAPYHVLRFMDWNLSNDTNDPQADWNTRKKKTESQASEPIAFEWQIDLCNRTQEDYWLNVPYEASSDYWTKLAQLVFDQLDPRLRVYLEWSNEVWAKSWAATGATQHQLANGNAYYVYESIRMFEAFEAVFGKGSPRIVKVLAGQAAWTGPCEDHVTALADAKVNPNGTRPDFYAIAPYFGGTSTSALKSDLTTVTGWTQASKTCATKMGVPLISYEGGSDSYAAGAGCVTLQHDAGMHDLYVSYFDAISGAGLTGPFMQYTHVGSCWGLKEKTSDASASSPKYQGVLDWLAAHP